MHVQLHVNLKQGIFYYCSQEKGNYFSQECKMHWNELLYTCTVRKSFLHMVKAGPLNQSLVRSICPGPWPHHCLRLTIHCTYTEICSPRLACYTWGAEDQEICHALLYKHEHKGFHCSVVSVQRNERNSVTITTIKDWKLHCLAIHGRCWYMYVYMEFYPNRHCISLSVLNFGHVELWSVINEHPI